MAKVHFFYSAMNAGKTTTLLQTDHNYKIDGFQTLLLKPAIDNRFDVTKITSRIGLEANAIPIKQEDNLIELVKEQLKKENIRAISVDEAQFFTEKQIHELCYIADRFNISILAYGLKTDFQGKLFEGSKALIELANELKEIKKLCHCQSKATMVLRYNQNGEVLRKGDIVEIGAEDKYVSVCRKHFFEGDIGNLARNSLKNISSFLEKEKYASIISRNLKWRFKDSLNYSLENKELLIEKIKNEIKENELIIRSNKNNCSLKTSLEKTNKSLFSVIEDLN